MEDDSAKVNALMSGSSAISTAVGPVLYLEIEIEGVPVKAVVDSGGHPSPTLELPSATLYGKGGRDIMFIN